MSDLTPSTERGKHPGLLVLLAGLGTGAATLFLLYYLEQEFAFHLMGFYANYVLPVGAILVGLVAGSGYGLASWLTGARINRALLVMVVVLQVAIYFFAQNVEYLLARANMPPGLEMSFWEYFDLTTQAFAWDNNGKPGAPFGMWGYAMRALEIAGFALGGIVAPAILFSVPYCGHCGVYMRTRTLGQLPAGVPKQKIKKRDTVALEAYQAQQAQALEQAQQRVASLFEAAQAGMAQDFADELAEHAPHKKEITKSTGHVAVLLHLCPRCSAGNVLARLQLDAEGVVSATDIGLCPVEAGFVRDVEMYGNHRLT